MQADDKISSAGKIHPPTPTHSPLADLHKHYGDRQPVKLTQLCRKIHPARTNASLARQFASNTPNAGGKTNSAGKSIHPAPTHFSLASLRQTRRMQADGKTKSAGKIHPPAPMHSPLAGWHKHAGGRRTAKLNPSEKSIHPAPTHFSLSSFVPNKSDAGGR